MASVQTLGPQVASVVAGTTAIQVATASTTNPVISWTLQNQGTGTVYLGGSAVTSSAGGGLQIPVAGSVTYDINTKLTAAQPFGLDNYWLITAATGAQCVLFYNVINTRR